MACWRGHHGWDRNETGKRRMWSAVDDCVTPRVKLWGLRNHNNSPNTIVFNNLQHEDGIKVSSTAYKNISSKIYHNKYCTIRSQLNILRKNMKINIKLSSPTAT